jgi:hypothetical protein
VRHETADRAAAVAGRARERLAGDHPCHADAIRENAGTVDADAAREILAGCRVSG